MKNSHRFSEPCPENPRRPRVKTTDRTKIELDLKDAYRLADVLDEVIDWDAMKYYSKLSNFQLINLLIKKLRNAEPELEF